jgi:hypothetical protein
VGGRERARIGKTGRVDRGEAKGSIHLLPPSALRGIWTRGSSLHQVIELDVNFNVVVCLYFIFA